MIAALFFLAAALHPLSEPDNPIVKASKEIRLDSFPCFAYPISDLDPLFEALGKKTVTIFAYGSLLNEKSAAKSLSIQALRTYRPALVFGYSRTFDRHVPKTKWKKERPGDTGMLNLFENSNGLTNGVIFEATRKDLHSLLAREQGYDLVPVVVIPWEYQGKKPQIAYTFIASSQLRGGIHYTSEKINPVPAYAKLSQKGALRFGADYMQFWIDSTYLSDRKTPYAEWLKNPAIDLSQ